MARQDVVMIKCDRCKREELVASDGTAKATPDFELQFLGTRLVFPDLCGFCKETIKNSFERIKEWERDLKSLLGPKVKANEAPPVTVAPDYSPPKPHSAAASTKR